MADSKPQGFFAKDEDFGTRLDEKYAEGEQFVILSIEHDTPFTNPKTGETIKTRTKMNTREFDAETLNAVGLPVEVKTLGGVIHDHVNEQVPGDFPAVCYWTTVDVEKWGNKAMILRRVSPYPVPDEVRKYLVGDE